MKRKFIKKSIIYTLISSMLLGSTTPALAGKDYSIGEVTETQESNKNENLNTTVYAELGSFFKVTIPKHIVLDGTEKKGEYLVTAVGDIAGYETLYIKPDDSFVLKSANLNDVTATINQNKTSWKFDEMLEGSNILGNGTIDAAGITAGSWNGNFNFNINLDGSTTSIKVEAKDENGNDLNASATNIVGEEKEQLLNSLVETNYINSVDEVDAIINVSSDNFDDIAHTTFDVSNLYENGDKVAILHFNEETNEWEYICTDVVTDGKVQGDFTSYSPVAFIKVSEGGNLGQIDLTPGLYDANGGRIATWEASGIDIEKDYTNNAGAADCFSVCTSSAYYVINNNPGYANVTKIVLPEGITKIGDFAFYFCPMLTDITIPNNVISIGDSAFSYTNLTSVTIPDGVTDINPYMFYDCKNLSSINIPNSVTSIGEWAFYGCKSLTNITIPDSVTNISSLAFGRTGLTSINIPNSVTSIGSSAFTGCSNLTNITISNSVTSIDTSVFQDCSSLTNVTIPNSIISIGNYAFYGCTSLTNIIIPDNVISIGSRAFQGCTSLTNITIPNKVTSIGSNAFYYCTVLTSVTFKDTTTWYVGDSGGAIATKIDVTNASTNATNLKSTYYDKYWTKK